MNNQRSFKTIIMDNGANRHMFSDKWMFTRYEASSESSFVIAAGGQRLLILGQGDIGNLFDVLHVEGIVKNLISLTYLARLGCSYFGKFEFCDLFDVNGNILIRGLIKEDDLLVVDIQDLFNIPCINCDAIQNFQHNYSNQENIILLTINLYNPSGNGIGVMNYTYRMLSQ